MISWHPENGVLGKDTRWERACDAHDRMPSFGGARVFGHGGRRGVHTCEHVSVLHAQPARWACEGARCGGYGGVSGICGGLRHKAHSRARALHAESRLQQASNLRVRSHGAARRPCPHGADVLPSLQHASWKPRRAGRGGGHWEDFRCAKRGAKLRPGNHAFA